MAWLPLAIGVGAWLVAFGLMLLHDRRRQCAAIEHMREGNVVPLRQRSADERRAAAELYPRHGLAEVAPIRPPSPAGQVPNLICSDPDCARTFYSAAAGAMVARGDTCVCGAKLRLARTWVAPSLGQGTTG